MVNLFMGSITPKVREPLDYGTTKRICDETAELRTRSAV